MKDIDIAKLAAGQYSVTSESVIDAISKRLRAALDRNMTMHVEITEHKKRSMTQNALFHVWCREIARDLTLSSRNSNDNIITQESVKEFLKARFLATELKPQYDYSERKIVMMERPVSTAGLTRGEMHHFMTNVHEWCCAHTINVSIPALSEYVTIEQEMNM